MTTSTAGEGIHGRDRLVLVLVAVALSVPAGAQTRQEIAVGGVALIVAPRPPGMRVLVDGIEVIKHSELVVTKPPWAPHYYLGPTESAVREATCETVDGGKVLQLKHGGARDSFHATETLRLHADGRLEQVFEGVLLEEGAEGLVSWRLAALNPVLLVGRPYEAVMVDGSVERGVVPVTAASGEMAAATLAKGFKAITFDSRLGLLRIEVEAEHALVLFDHRKNRWASANDPYFWFGDLGTRFEAGERLHYRVVYHLPTRVAAALEARKVAAVARVQRRPDAQVYPVENPPTLIPQPKEATYRGADVALRVPLEIGCTPEATTAGAARRLLAANLERRFGVEATMHPGEQVVFAASPDGLLPAEGYELAVDGDRITIAAGGERGFRNAVHTLVQLVEPQRDGSLRVRGAKIRDWPTLGVRGIHMFTGGQGPGLHLKLIRNILGPLKLNHLVLESEYIEWDAYPEIHHPKYGMPKSEVRQILAACDEHGIKVTPLVMALGHCQWMFETGHHLDLAEDPEAKWAYCVTNPDTYDFIFKIYAEALELFQPDWFHIGHDEYTDRGRVPHRESSQPYTVEELFMMDTLRLHGWLKERGVRTMMWGDMLLAPGEGPDACNAQSVASAAALREELPNDVLIADWHYCGNPPADFTNLDVFHRAGHETVAATWDRPNNIVHFAQAAYEQGALGLLQTTWAGYSLDEESFAREMHQYAAYVLAAEAAWNADRPPDPEMYPAKSHFLDLMGLSTLKPAYRSGWVADLRGAYNYPLAAEDASGWFGLGPEHDLSRMPGGAVRFKGVAFRLADPSDAAQSSAIVLRSKLAAEPALPTEVQLTLDATATQLVILHTTSCACDAGARVGEYELTYADGTTAAIDVTYGENVMAYNDLTAVPAAPIVWSGRTAAEQPVALRVLVWDLPHPDKVIRALELRSGAAAGALVVLGITGLDDAAMAGAGAGR